jgi:hypothetical protein
MKDTYSIEYRDNAGVTVGFEVDTNDIQHTLREIANGPLWEEFTSVKKL